MAAAKIKKGDTVVVRSGKDKGRSGTVLQVMPKEGKVLVAGVNIVELDPEDSSVGYGGLPNADGVVQLDSCCMHGPKKTAGGVGADEDLVAVGPLELGPVGLDVGIDRELWTFGFYWHFYLD